MDLRQLGYFVAVADEGQFTRAATRMAVAQPAVSSQVRQLERELGEPLFLRDRRGATLTEAGRTLLPHARSALAAAERGRASVASLRGLLHGQLRIGVSRPVDDRLTGTLGRFHRAHPDVEIAVAEEQNEPLLHSVANGEIDAALVGMNSRRGLPPSVATRLLGVEPLIVAVRPGVPLSKARALTLSQLREQPMVTLTHGSGLRAVLDNACRTAGFVPRLAAETGDLASVVELAREGLGVSILPRSAVEDSGLIGVPLTRPRLRRQTVLAWNSTTTSPAARAFLALAELHMPTQDDRQASGRRHHRR